MQLISVSLVREKGYDYSPMISSPDTAYDWIKYHTEDLSTETVWILFLTQENKVSHARQLAVGGTDYCSVDMKEIFRTALLCNATRIIMVHNHPTGNLAPSSSDWNVVRKLQDACQIMDMSLLDSIIVSYRGKLSMRESYKEKWKEVA